VGFNAYLHDEPFSAQRAGLPFHWHADLFPRLGDRAGFEWGSGMALNVIDPDAAAESLRGGLAREAR
jgi:galactose-1-phosphate uridylyltransferase